MDDDKLKELEKEVQLNESIVAATVITPAVGENNIVPTTDTPAIPESNTPDPEQPPLINDQQPKKKGRVVKSTNFNGAEAEYLDTIFYARLESGLSRDYNHFIRQCIDFAVNHGKHPSSTFAVPEQPVQYLNDAFFKPEIKQ